MIRGGAIVLRRRDDDGEITVVDSDDIRYLYFANDVVQSAVDLTDPAQLVLSYTRAMACGLLFCDRPKTGLMIGLGGGALVHFINRHFWQTELTVVEQRETLINIARDYFLLAPLTNVRYVAEDGLYFLLRDESRFDFILVDAFDENGLSKSIVGVDFLAACRRRLSADGLIILNLWRSQVLVTEELIAQAQEQFDGRVLTLALPDKGNLIVLAGPAIPRSLHWRPLRERAKELEPAWGIELRKLLKHVKPHAATNWWTSALRALSKN